METNKGDKSRENKDKTKKRMQTEEPKSQHNPDHTSQGHTTDAKGSATSSKEPTLRGSATDSSRALKNPHDDMPTGGNVR